LSRGNNLKPTAAQAVVGFPILLGGGKMLAKIAYNVLHAILHITGMVLFIFIVAAGLLGSGGFFANVCDLLK
jgi:hypothetical protein